MVRFTLLLGLFLFSAIALAAEVTLFGGHQWSGDFQVAVASEGSPSLSSTTIDEDVDLDSGSVTGLAIDFVFRNDMEQRIGFFASQQQSRFAANAGISHTRLDITHLHLTFMRYYPNDKWEPFVLAGVGAVKYSPDSFELSDETHFSAQLGGGVSYRITDNLLLRIDARWLPTFFDSEGEIFCSGGCDIRIDSELFNHFQLNTGLMYRF